MTEHRRCEQVSLLQLMREARDVYRRAIRGALERAGCDDLPRNAIVVLTSLAQQPVTDAYSPQSDVIASLGLSKQMASQLIDTLVVRSYLDRRNDPVDRRRMELRLTPRGRRTATVIQEAVDEIEAAVSKLISADEQRGMRAGLAAYRAVRQQT